MMLAAVGPLSLGEHAMWFALLSLFVFLVYNGLRNDSVKNAAVTGVRRWLVFMLGAGLLAAVSLTLSYLL